MCPALAQLSILPCKSCRMAAVCWANLCVRVLQRGNAAAHRKAVGWFQALLAHDLSKMRAHFNHDFRLVVALSTAPSWNFAVAQDHMVRNRLASWPNLELLKTIGDRSSLILLWSRRLGSCGFSNWPIDRRLLGRGNMVSGAFNIGPEAAR
jgi:hypothetical protein